LRRAVVRQRRPAQKFGRASPMPVGRGDPIQTRKRHAAVFFIEGQPAEANPVAIASSTCSIPIRHFGRGPRHRGCRPPGNVPGPPPNSRQEQGAGQHTRERILRIIIGIQQCWPTTQLSIFPVSPHHCVARPRFGALLRVPELSSTPMPSSASWRSPPDAATADWPARDPRQKCQKLLQRSHRHAVRQRDRLHAFAFEMANNPST